MFRKRLLLWALILVCGQRMTRSDDMLKVVEHPNAGKLVLISAGQFEMGAIKEDRDATDIERPAFNARVSRDFFLGIHEVTFIQFRRFVSATGHKTDGEKSATGCFGYDKATRRFVSATRYSWRDSGFPHTDEHPVANVSWNDAVAYCRWLSDRDEQYVFRLPTEAEWEYAYRADTHTVYAFGKAPRSLVLKENIGDKSLSPLLDPAGSTEKRLIDRHADWNDRFPFTSPVGSFKPNAWGLYDMGGNVNEWCEDYFDRDQYVRGSSQPPATGTTRVFRGGSFIWGAHHSRCSAREHKPATDSWCHMGFRLAADLKK